MNQGFPERQEREAELQRLAQGAINDGEPWRCGQTLWDKATSVMPREAARMQEPDRQIVCHRPLVPARGDGVPRLDICFYLGAKRVVKDWPA
jgi:hypothetical protein